MGKALCTAVMVLVACGSSRDGQPRGPFKMRSTPTKVIVTPLIAADAASWPNAAPISVALSPDAKQFAFTTGGGELFVQPLANGQPKKWSTTSIDGAVALYVAGFFSDGALAVLSPTQTNEWRLYKLTEKTATLLHSAPTKLLAAISPVGDRTIVATSSTISEVTPKGLRTIATAEPGDRILALAISPDGTRIANMRDPAFEVTEQIHVTTMEGADLGWKQRFGSSPGHGNELLAWLDKDRFVFAGGDADNERDPTGIFAEGIADGFPETRAIWPVDSYVGLGSAAKGILLVVRAGNTRSVQVGGSKVPGTPTRLIGWTKDHRPVVASGFWREETIMRGAQPWPGTKVGDEGDAVVGDDVILHRMEDNGFVVERLDAAGKRTRLTSTSMANTRWRPQLVRCAGESAAPCMIEHVEYEPTSWFDFDPITGKRGEELYSHPIKYPNGPTPNAARSPDGKTLAVVDESATITIVVNKKSHALIVEGVGAFDSIVFATNDKLVASARDVRGRPFAIVRLDLDRKAMQLRLDEASLAPGDAMRIFMRPTPSRDGAKLAVGVRELHTEIVRVGGL